MAAAEVDPATNPTSDLHNGSADSAVQDRNKSHESEHRHRRRKQKKNKAAYAEADEEAGLTAPRRMPIRNPRCRGNYRAREGLAWKWFWPNL